MVVERLDVKRVCSILVLASLVVLFVQCSDSEDDTRPNEWVLIWEDNFDGEQGGSPDSSKWVFDIGTGWGNQQLEFDTERPENVSTDGNGHLLITAIKEPYLGSEYTSGRIKTKGLLDKTYGRFEARMKMPWGQGYWPAFWLLGSNITQVGWPQCGEIDIMEYKGQEPQVVHGSVHGPGYSGGNAVTRRFTQTQGRLDQEFHLFSVEWTEDRIDYFIDETLYLTLTPNSIPGEWVFDHDFHIILNLAIGGNFVGPPTDQTVFPQSLVVDYIRVYDLEE